VSGTATLEVACAKTLERLPDSKPATHLKVVSLMCDEVCEDPVLVACRTVTARFFTGKFVVEVVYALEDGAVVITSGKVWKK
jgi:hypothetical protein